MEPVIVTESLTKVYKAPLEPSVTALQDLNLEVYPGEVFALVGPNGSGKTTTLKLLLGLIFPTRGTARVFGENPRSVEVKRRIGFMPDGPYFYGHLTGNELLDFYADILQIPRSQKKQRIEELVELVGMKGRSHLQVRTYSKGMIQRIGLAQALLNDPELVLLDEPTAGLDPIGTRDVKDIILKMRQQGKTVFLCSHLLSDVERIADRVAVLHQGRLIRLGTMEELLVVKGRFEVQASRLSAEALEALGRMGEVLEVADSRIHLLLEEGEALQKALALIEAKGGHLDYLAPQRRTLEEVFIEAVREAVGEEVIE